MSLGLKNEVPEKRKEIANFADEPKPIVVPKHPLAIIQPGEIRGQTPNS